MTILLVDDNKINLFTLEKLLANSGYRDFISLESANDLLNYLNTSLKASEVDLILLDIMMPKMDGIEACKLIRADEQFNNIQIIFVTALEDKERLVEALDSGGNDFVSKPIHKTELLARIRVSLRLKKELDWHTEYDKQIQNELTLAAKVQQNLLSLPFENDKLKIAVSYQPSAKLAGDMYYWHPIDDDRYGIILIDMMGHGISASLVCMYISSILREAIKNTIEPTAVMQELNRYMLLLPTNKEDIPFYFSAIYLIVDTKNKTVEYVNAGHPPCYISLDDKEAQPLNPNAMAIGFFHDLSCQVTTLSFKKNLQIILFTDGVIEALDKDEFKADKELQRLASKRWSYSNHIFDEVLPQQKQSNQADDMSIILIQI